MVKNAIIYTDKEVGSKIYLVSEETISEISTNEALDMAENQNMNLVQVGIRDNIAVCKIIDVKKEEYNRKKSKKAQKAPSVKEIRMGCNISSHDIEVKTTYAKKLLSAGNWVKFVITYKGRQMSMIADGKKKMQEILNDFTDVATVKDNVRIDGNNVTATVIPKKD